MSIIFLQLICNEMTLKQGSEYFFSSPLGYFSKKKKKKASPVNRFRGGGILGFTRAI